MYSGTILIPGAWKLQYQITTVFSPLPLTIKIFLWRSTLSIQSKLFLMMNLYPGRLL
jgi:hypothetical protein